MYRVVLADDEREYRIWLRNLLETGEHFQVVGDAGTGTEALKLVARLKPDIVITDLYMPDGDGLSVARSVQRQRPGTKVVLVSAHAGRGYERLATEDEALAFIPKSEFTLEALRQVLEEEA